MAAAPVGARGMVVRVGPGEIGHVLNVVHHPDGFRALASLNSPATSESASNDPGGEVT